MPHYLVLCTYAVRSGYAYPSALLWVDPLINKVGPCQNTLEKTELRTAGLTSGTQSTVRFYLAVGRERKREPCGIPRGWCSTAQVLVAGVGVAGAEGCDHGVQRQLPVSAHSRKPASPHAHAHAPIRARTRTWQRFGGLSLPLPT